MGLEDRDWYREESSRAYWREVNRSAPQGPASGRTANISGGLLAAVCVSAGFFFAGQLGYLPKLKLPSSERSPDANAIRLSSTTGFDTPGPAGKRWCITTGQAGRVCAVTGSAESGRDALTRALRSKGIGVAP
jgi:hypothetical protein